MAANQLPQPLPVLSELIAEDAQLDQQIAAGRAVSDDPLLGELRGSNAREALLRGYALSHAAILDICGIGPGVLGPKPQLNERR